MPDFDQLFNQVLEFARKGELLTKFTALSTDRERAEAVTALPQLREYTASPSYRGKSETDAERERARGDALCLKGDLGGAVAMYSSAIRLSPCGSLTLVRSYEARCTLLHRQGFYSAALQDVESVMHTVPHQSPETTIKLLHIAGSCWQNKSKWEDAERTYQQALAKLRESQMNNATKAVLAGELIQRLKQAQQHEKQKTNTINADCSSDEEKELPVIDYGRNVNLPSCSSAITLQCSPGKGRHMVANEDITIGSVLIVEEPFAWSLSREAMANHCLHCCRIVLASVPCIQCATVSYCSTRCRDLAWQAYHRLECEVLDHFHDSQQLSVMALVVYRTVLASVDPDTCQLSAQFRELHGEGGGSPAEQVLFSSSDYVSVFNQVTNASARSGGDLLKRAVSAVFLVRCLQRVLPGVGDEATLVAAALRHLQSSSCNAYEICEQRVPGGEVRVAECFEMGGAVYPAISLCNHSCYPNIARHSYGKVCVVRAQRSIRKGEEVLDNYGPHFLSDSLEKRRELLKGQYSFECVCEACVQAWPRGDELQKQRTQYKCGRCNKNIGYSLITNCTQCNRKSDSKKTVKKLQEMSKKYKTALESLLSGGRIEDCVETCIKYAALLESVASGPNMELVRCQQAITQCWSLLANVDNRNR